MIRVTILCDNIVGVPLGIGEHGFSAFVETETEAILFDTGRGAGIIPNSMAFGKDLRGIKKICISHGHFDHTEGLPQVLGLARQAEIYAHPGIFQERYGEKRIGDTVIRRFAGVPFRRDYLESLGARLNLDSGFREVAPGVYLTGEVPRKTPFEKGDKDLFVPSGSTFVQDPILDDQSLVAKTSKGLVVVFGCAHAGAVNTLQHAREKTGEERIQAVLGGTHLGFLSDEQLKASIQELKAMNPAMVAVSHCTGMKPALRLMAEFGDRFAFAHVGSAFQFE